MKIYIVVLLFIVSLVCPKQHIEYHQNGVMKEIGDLDRYNDKQGRWFSYSQDGSLVSYTDYKNGFRHGRMVLFYSDGKTIWIDNGFKNGKHHGMCYWFNEDGTVGIIEIYEQGVQEYMVVLEGGRIIEEKIDGEDTERY